MRYVILFVVLSMSVACERDQPAPAQTAAQTTAKPTKNHRALAPDKQVLAYYQAMQQGRVHDAYEMVHEADRQAKSIDDFLAAANDPLQRTLMQKRKFEVKGVKIDGGKARVDVDTTGPDVAKAQKEIVPQLTTKLAEFGQKPTSEMLKQALQVAVEQDKIPMMVTNNTLYLTQNEAGEWKLDFDWDAEHPGREVPMKSKPDAGE